MVEKSQSVVGVVGGDPACVRSLVRKWCGRPVPTWTTHARSSFAVRHEHRHQELWVLGSTPTPGLVPWPGGPLVWLFPERGPSAPELAELRRTISLSGLPRPSVRILVCMPHDVSIETASADLGTIANTLAWSMDPDTVVELEHVWLEDNSQHSLDRWVETLAMAAIT